MTEGQTIDEMRIRERLEQFVEETGTGPPSEGRPVTIKPHPNPSRLAETFWEMDSVDQMFFFNHLAETIDLSIFERQMDFVAREGSLSEDAVKIMAAIGASVVDHLSS